MNLRAALTIALVIPSGIALTGPVAPTYAAAAVCQGQPATIEGSTGTITGTEGNDVIVSTGAATDVRALGGNDLVCVVGGNLSTGTGDDSVVSTAPAGTVTVAYMSGGTDTFVGGAGGSDVIVDEISSFHVTMGGGGTMELYPTSIPGSGTVDFGASSGFLYAFGLEKARVDLAAQTASVDDLLTVTTAGVHSATATGCKVRMKGDGENNVLGAYGHNIVITGGGGRDRLARVGNGFDLDLPECGAYRSVLRGESGADRMTGRLGDDVLKGGTGHDVANGAGGVDKCRAEVRKNCER